MVHKINGPLDLEERDENDRFHEPSVLVSPVHTKSAKIAHEICIAGFVDCR